MSWKSALTLCFCALTFIATGCGEKDGEGNNNNSITFEEFENQSPKLLAEYLCNGVFSCPEKQQANMLFLAGRFKDKAECIANLPSILGTDGSQFSKESIGIKEGRLEFNSERAAKCVARIKEEMKQCTAIDIMGGSSTLNDCEKAFDPKVEANAPCASDNECISNNCSYANTTECFGRCAAAIETAKEGEACNSNGCTPGLHCVSKLDNENERICVKPGTRKKGEKCEDSPAVCADNLVCTIQSICDDRVPLAKSGESCDLSKTICTPGLTCIDLDINMAQQTLVGICGPPKAVGASCIMILECQNDLYCTGDFSTPGECAAKKKAGEACTESEQCATALFCDPSSDKCVTEKDDTPACVIPTE